jgi:CRP-like cAMP-binding protein
MSCAAGDKLVTAASAAENGAMDDDFDLESFTRQSKLFEQLDLNGRQRMMKLAQRLNFEIGAVLFREGDPGDSFFVITRGTVHVTVDDLGTTKRVATLGTGSFFGEIAVITNQPRSATVTAATALEVLRFDKTGVLEVLHDSPRAREVVAMIGMHRTEDTMEKISGLSEAEATVPNKPRPDRPDGKH